jgi:hypothetical protein
MFLEVVDKSLVCIKYLDYVAGVGFFYAILAKTFGFFCATIRETMLLS